MVSVGKWTRHNAPWNSTLYGIADHLWGNGDAWRAIWYAPQNKTLREQRKDPEEIQPGDKIWVPTAPPGGGSDNPSGHPARRGRESGGQDNDSDHRGHRRRKY